MATQEMYQRLENDFTYHPACPDQADRYKEIRATAKRLATVIIESSFPSREQSLALTNLDQAVFWANAGIARNEPTSAAKTVD